MNYKTITEQLMRYTPSPEEETFKTIMLDFATTSPNVFERSHCCGHFTASAWLLNKEKTHALVMHHKKLDRWFQLGGHCDGDHNTAAVALKEAQEESGILGIGFLQPDIFDIDIHWIPSNPKEVGHYHYDVRYLLVVTSDEQIVQNAESKELRWIPLDGQLPTNNPSVVRMFEKCKDSMKLK